MARILASLPITRLALMALVTTLTACSNRADDCRSTSSCSESSDGGVESAPTDGGGGSGIDRAGERPSSPAALPGSNGERTNVALQGHTARGR